MSQEEEVKPGEAIVEALGCVAPILLVILIPVLLFSMLYEHTKETNKKLSEQRYEIEGVVASIEIIDVPPPPTLDEINAEREKEGKRRINIYIDSNPYYPKKTKITFEDGRNKEFNGVTSKPIEVGKYYVIIYDGHKCITDFKVTNPDSQGTMKMEKEDESTNRNPQGTPI